jgi:hypothetical protein
MIISIIVIIILIDYSLKHMDLLYIAWLVKYISIQLCGFPYMKDLVWWDNLSFQLYKFWALLLKHPVSLFSGLEVLKFYRYVIYYDRIKWMCLNIQHQ